MTQLTRGAVESMHKGQQIPTPLVQVIDVKKILGPNGQATTPERYRLVISDGEHFQQAMLATQLNDLVKVDGRSDRKLVPKCIIRLNEYICNTVHGRRIVIVLNVDVMGPPLSHTIGNPQNIEGGAASSDASVGGATAAPSASSRPMPHQQQQQPHSGFGGGGGARGMSGGGSAPTLPEGVIPIKGLHPYQSRWTIKARVTARTDLKNFNGSRGPSSLFSVDLLDAFSGEIRCTFFGEAAQEWDSRVAVGQVYLIGRGNVKFANKRFSNLKNEYEISLDRNAQVELVPDDGSIPNLKFSFVDIADLPNQDKDTFIDIIGVLLDVGNLDDFQSKAGNALKKRILMVADASNAQAEVTLWGDQAAGFSGEKGNVVIMKGVKVSDFNDRSLTVLRSTKIEFEPSGVPEADKVRSWYHAYGHSEVPSVSSRTPRTRADGGAGGDRRNFKDNDTRRTFAQIKKQPPLTGTSTYFNVRATITEIKHSRDHPPWYEACPKEGCNKKVTAVGGAFHCAKCSFTYDTFNPRYILNVNANDHSGSAWLTCFNDTAPHILDKQAEELFRTLASGDTAQYEDVFQKALFNTYTLRVRAAENDYEGDTRVKLSVVGVTPLDHAHESKLLIGAISKYLSAA